MLRIRCLATEGTRRSGLDRKAKTLDECKTEGSDKTFVLAEDLLARLKAWKQVSQFNDGGDWIFASPFNIGRLPYAYTGTRQELVRASKAAGLGHISTHAFRHTYRCWLDAVKTPIAVQQKDDASHGHQNHDERLRGRGYG